MAPFPGSGADDTRPRIRYAPGVAPDTSPPEHPTLRSVCGLPVRLLAEMPEHAAYIGPIGEPDSVVLHRVYAALEARQRAARGERGPAWDPEPYRVHHFDAEAHNRAMLADMRRVLADERQYYPADPRSHCIITGI